MGRPATRAPAMQAPPERRWALAAKHKVVGPEKGAATGHYWLHAVQTAFCWGGELLPHPLAHLRMSRVRMWGT